MNLRSAASALMTLAIAILAGCNGGGGGGGNVAPAPVALPTTPGGAVLAVTVNSPPVVTFAVIDATGAPVTGLKLFDPAGRVGDPACGGANVTFAMAKFDGANWQSLISRQRYAVDDLSDPAAPKRSVLEGTTDPKPTATIVNPATALADPATRVVGILEENAGMYTYRFATDVTTPLPMANAVAGRNVSLGKVANNGHLAVKDGRTVHRVVLQLCYVDPATQKTVKANPFLDFTLGADGRAAPFVDAQGAPIAHVQVAARESCNECHRDFAQHGGNRVDPRYCVVCHNPGSADFETGNGIDFKLMVHKFHMGKRLTQDYAVRSAVARKNTAGTITGVLYPQDQRNCVKCHDGSATAAHRTAQGDNWKTKPSKNACMSCHDDYKTPGSKWQLAHAGYASLFQPSVGNPDATPDAICLTCHNDAGTGVAKTIAKAHEVAEWAKGESYRLNLWSLVRNPDNTVTVEYSVSNPLTGLDYDILDPQYRYTVVNAAGTVTTRNFTFGSLNMLFGWNNADYANDGAIGRPWGSSCTVAPTAAPTCDPATGLPKAGTAGPIARGQPVSINAVFDSTVQRVGAGNRFRLTSTVVPAGAAGTLAVAFQGRINEQKDANTSWTVPVPNVVGYLALSGNAMARRKVVSAEKCNACHGRNLAFTSLTTFRPGLGAHGGNRNQPEVCVICHNGNNPLPGTYVTAGQVTQYAESADFKRMIHMMHAEQEENYPVWPKALITTKLNAQIYSGLKNCDTCHIDATYAQNQSVLGTSVTFDVDLSRDVTTGNGATVTDIDASNNMVISAKASVCSSCHASAEARTHMSVVGGAAFGTATQAEFTSGAKVLELCDSCHQPGGMMPVDVVHLGVAN